MYQQHLEEEEHQIRGDRDDDDIPRSSDPEAVFREKKARLTSRVLPMTLVPLSSANGMLVLGSGLDRGDCYFPLMEFLVAGGALSLTMVVAAVACKHVLEWILPDGEGCVTRRGQLLLRGLRHLGTVLAVLQGLIVLAGSIIVFPELGRLNYESRSDPHYCEEGPVIFSAFVLSMCWVGGAFLLVCYVYIHYVEGREMKGARSSKARKNY